MNGRQSTKWWYHRCMHHGTLSLQSSWVLNTPWYGQLCSSLQRVGNGSSAECWDVAHGSHRVRYGSITGNREMPVGIGLLGFWLLVVVN